MVFKADGAIHIFFTWKTNFERIFPVRFYYASVPAEREHKVKSIMRVNMKIVKEIFALGTANTITLKTDDGKKEKALETLGEIRNFLLDLDDRLSCFKKGSEISRAADAAGKGYSGVSEDTLKLIKKAMEYGYLSKGAFDITAGPLTELWRRAAGEGKLPDPAEIEAARQLVGFRDIQIAEVPAGIRLKREGMSIDLGGIAKGYAADAAAEMLERYGFRTALINFGGTVRVLGGCETIGIQSPEGKKGEIIGTLLLNDMAAVTSGIYERYFVKDGKAFHHIIDVRTGWPSESEVASVTVIGKKAMDLDALATSVLLLGLEEGSALVRKTGAEAVFAAKDGKIYITSGLKNNFKFMEKSK